MHCLINGGIDVVSLANNHIKDYGDIGLEDTIHYLDKWNIKHIGAGKNIKEAREPVYFNANGLNIV